MSSPFHTIELPAPHATLGSAVLLPGHDLCAEFYVPLGRKLAHKGLDTTLVTLPGYDAVPPLDDPGWPALREATVRLLRTALGRHGTLIGHSLGGLLAFLCAAELGDQVSALVLMEPAIMPWRWLGRRAGEIYKKRVVDAERGRFVNHGPGYWRVAIPTAFPPDAFEIAARSSRQSDPATARALIADVDGLYPLPFEAVEAPTLLIRGARSGRMMAAGQLYLAWKLPNAKAVVVDNAAHWLANEQDDLLADAIARFVAARAAAAPA